MGDQMAPGWPDSERSCCLFAKYQGLLNKCEQKQASFDDQIAPGDQIGRPDFHILVTSKIWSSIWSPEDLVVDLFVVDAVTLSIKIAVFDKKKYQNFELSELSAEFNLKIWLS